MPVAVELNGLLPGRGPGRGAGRGPGEAGRGPAAIGRGASWRGCAGSAGGADRVGGSTGDWAASPVPPPANGSFGNGVGGAVGSGAPVGSGVTGAGGSTLAGLGSVAGACTSTVAELRPLAVCRCGAAAFAAPLPAGAWLANSFLSLRTTGASIVEDADRTNSPISWSLAMTALLSTPNSFASSYTRTFATALPLLGPFYRACQPAGAARAPSGVSLCCSSPHAHRALIASQPSFVRCPRLRTPSGTPRPCRPAGLPPGEGPAKMPSGGRLAPSMPGLGADMHPGQAAGRSRQERPRPLPQPRGASRTWPHARRSRCKYGPARPVRGPAYRACAPAAPAAVPGSSGGSDSAAVA
jgi:hypothetical protein